MDLMSAPLYIFFGMHIHLPPILSSLCSVEIAFFVLHSLALTANRLHCFTPARYRVNLKLQLSKLDMLSRLCGAAI